MVSLFRINAGDPASVPAVLEDRVDPCVPADLTDDHVQSQRGHIAVRLIPDTEFRSGDPIGLDNPFLVHYVQTLLCYVYGY